MFYLSDLKIVPTAISRQSTIIGHFRFKETLSLRTLTLKPENPGLTGEFIFLKCEFTGQTWIFLWQRVHIKPGWNRRRCGRVPAASAGDGALAAHQCDVLFAVEHVGDRRAHAASLAGWQLEKFFAFVRAVGHQTAVIQDLKHEIPRGR